MQPQMRWSKNQEENLLGSFSQSASSASADPNMTQMGVVGTNAAIPRLPKLNGRVNFPVLVAHASCTRKFDLGNSWPAMRSVCCCYIHFMHSTYRRQLTEVNFQNPSSASTAVRPKITQFCRNQKNRILIRTNLAIDTRKVEAFVCQRYSGNPKLDSTSNRLTNRQRRYTSSNRLPQNSSDFHRSIFA